MMDRALKERIIGAGVLVLFVVLVVPVFLDGPPGDNEIVTERVLLPGQTEQKNQTVVLNRDRTDPVPAASSGPVAAVTQAEQTANDPEPQPAPTSPPAEENVVETDDDAPTPAATDDTAEPIRGATTGMWAVQLGSFGEKGNAEKLAAELRGKNFLAVLSLSPSNSRPLHRVRVGPQKDRPSADAMAERLRKAGYDPQVVPHP